MSTSYDVETIDAGERRVVPIPSGGVLENTLYDVTANNARVVFNSNGGNWTMRNIGVRGQIDYDDTDAMAGIDDTQGGTSTVENVYFGDGTVPTNTATGWTGFWVNPNHSGTINFINCNVSGVSDNAFYASAPGGSGVCNFYDCYASNNATSHYRLAQGELEGCVVYDSPSSHQPGGRGVWAWSPGTVEVRDCVFDMNGRHWSIRSGAHTGSTHVDVWDTDYDTENNGGLMEAQGTITLHSGNTTNPNAYVPEGTPTSAEEAASGEGGGGGPIDPGIEPLPAPDVPDPYNHAIVYRNEFDDNATMEYHHEVSDHAEATEAEGTYDATIVPGSFDIFEEAGSVHIMGTVEDGERHAFFYGDGTEGLDTNGVGEVQINDTIVDTDNYGTPNSDVERPDVVFSMNVNAPDELRRGETGEIEVMIANQDDETHTFNIDLEFF